MNWASWTKNANCKYSKMRKGLNTNNLNLIKFNSSQIQINFNSQMMKINMMTIMKMTLNTKVMASKPLKNEHWIRKSPSRLSYHLALKQLLSVVKLPNLKWSQRRLKINLDMMWLHFRRLRIRLMAGRRSLNH